MYERNRHPAHVWWFVHQIMADLMEYAFVVAQAAVAQDSGGSISVPPLPRAKYQFGLAQRYEACEGGWLTSIGFGRGSAEASSQGWQMFEHEQSVKRGWLFNASQSAALLHARNHVPTETMVTHLRPNTNLTWPLAQLLEPITFKVRFGTKPVLSLSWLRSYENFGRALFWLDGERDAALAAYNEEHKFRSLCKKWYDGMPHAGSTCFDHNAGNQPEPNLLDGHWDDRSSQVYTAVPPGRYERHDGTTKLLSIWAPQPPMYYHQPLIDEPIATEGVHDISIAMLAPQPGEGALFKLLEIRTC